MNIPDNTPVKQHMSTRFAYRVEAGRLQMLAWANSFPEADGRRHLVKSYFYHRTDDGFALGPQSFVDRAYGSTLDAALDLHHRDANDGWLNPPPGGSNLVAEDGPALVSSLSAMKVDLPDEVRQVAGLQNVDSVLGAHNLVINHRQEFESIDATLRLPTGNGIVKADRLQRANRQTKPVQAYTALSTPENDLVGDHKAGDWLVHNGKQNGFVGIRILKTRTGRLLTGSGLKPYAVFRDAWDPVEYFPGAFTRIMSEQELHNLDMKLAAMSGGNRDAYFSKHKKRIASRARALEIFYKLRAQQESVLAKSDGNRKPVHPYERRFADVPDGLIEKPLFFRNEYRY